MPRPRTPKQALRQGLAATLTLLLGACQQFEGAPEAAAPEPVVVAPEPVVEAAAAPVVAAPEPSPPRPLLPAPAPARPAIVETVVIGGGATLSGNVAVPNNTTQNAAIGTVAPSTDVTIDKSASDVGTLSGVRPDGPQQPVPAEVVTSPSLTTAALDPVVRLEPPDAQREALDRLVALQEAEQAARAEDVIVREDAQEQVAAAAPVPIPQFPWPPPRASASAVIPAAFVEPSGVDTATLGDVADEISAALDTGGYFERSYFGAPGGFAMVTRLERINPDGTPADEAERWTVGALPLTSFSLAAYMRALFTAPSGRYRIIVFVVSSQPFAQSETEVAKGEALAWLSEGLNRLPDNIALAPFTPQHTVTALIYEFEQPGNQEATLMLPANLMGRVHLQRAQLWDALRQ